jgi:mannan endo-1,4-beta-mannosidase
LLVCRGGNNRVKIVVTSGLRVVLVLSVLLAMYGLAETAQDPVSSIPGMVGKRGTVFMLDGRPFNVAGVNNHYLLYGSPQEVLRVLDDAVAMRANVVRTFIEPVIGSVDGTPPPVWKWKSPADSSNLGTHGVYMLAWDRAQSRMIINDGANGLQRLDFLIAEAKQRNLKVIIAFLDFWAYTGGTQQMSAWYGSDDKYRFFAEDPRTRRDYKDFVQHVLTRVNERTGVSYRDDPTIFAWDLMNEPDIRPPALRGDWVVEMAKFVKSIDPNHLLTTGGDNISERLSDIAFADIDFATWHGYPAYYHLSPEQFDSLIQDFCAIGKTYDKPVLLEEFGMARSDPRQLASYRMWLATIRKNPDCAGWLIWRLVSRQDHGQYPEDRHDQFDIHNDGGPVWEVVKDAAVQMQAR